MGQRIGLVDDLALARRHPGQGIQWQSVAHGRIARQQEQVLPPQVPRAASPTSLGIAHERQGIAHHRAEATIEHLGKTLSIQLAGQARIARVEIHRQRAFAPQVVKDVLVAGQQMLGAHAESLGQFSDEDIGLPRAQGHIIATLGRQ